jgi:hypothetical protein
MVAGGFFPLTLLEMASLSHEKKASALLPLGDGGRDSISFTTIVQKTNVDGAPKGLPLLFPL